MAIGALLGVLAGSVAACGGSKVTGTDAGGGSGGAGAADGGGGSTADGAAQLHPPWTELAQPILSVQGGSAPSPRGRGQDGGHVHLVAGGDVSFDVTLPPPEAPPVPAFPSGAVSVGTEALAADVAIAGTARIDADTASGGDGAVRVIAAEGGDIFVAGTLRAADLGSARQGITLQATGGTVYVTGIVDTSGEGDGQAGGPIQIVARQVVVTGQLLSSGADSEAGGGTAGDIRIVATQSIVVTGVAEAFGGNARGDGAVIGGGGGGLSLQAGGDVGLAGTLRLRGGAATSNAAGDATGGAAASLTIDASGVVHVGGTLDARGGLAMAMAVGGAVVGGNAGAVLIGETTPPAEVAILVPLAATGGDGYAVGGKGGSVNAEPDMGSLDVASPRAIDVTGGSSLAMPGPGGLVGGGPRHDPGNGGLHISGDIVASGGSIQAGGSGNGAEGGRVDFELIPTDGPVTIDPSGKIGVDGGDAGGAGVAGGGGHIWLFTKDGDLTLAGTASARGGDAPDPGGSGGPGGMVYLFSDNNHNATQNDKGNLLIAPTGTIDASGGHGSVGGSARSDGHSGSWPVFPQDQEDIAIFLNCDGAHGETLNWMDNQGRLIARGGARDGNGGDIVFHGIGPGQLATPAPPPGNHHPPSGNVDLSADGVGQPGDYGGE